KVIIECALFAADVKRRLTEIVAESGAAYVKTSTGFAAGGATAADVRLLAEAAAGRIGVKAAGGIRDWSTCRAMLDAGANRIGTSAGVQIMQQWQASLFS
ncbi:MAG: 2-deoxyribose-5-phosphate aldolase, partial [Desulfuromonadales bacterium]